KILWIF
ncbi:toxin B domain protein, partial [Escherichia coli 97.0010]